MKALKILIFAGYYFPHHGGYTESIHGLSKELIKRGHSVTVATCKVDKTSPQTEVIDGVKVVRLPSWNILSGTYPVVIPGLKTWRIFRQLKKENYDIVSTQTRFFTTSFGGVLFALWNRKPVVHTERGAYHSIVEKKWVYFMSHCVDHTIGWFVIKCAKANIGVSKAATEFLRHIGAKDPKVIHNGVTMVRKPSAEEKIALKENLSFKKSDKILLFVGRLIYAKGLQDTLKVLNNLVKIEPQLKMVVLGGGPYRASLEALVQSEKLEKHVCFVGGIPAKEVKNYLKIADWFVNPSHSEGLPRSVLEAASAGLPVVATDVGGTNEIIDDGKSGFLVGLKDSSEIEKKLTMFLESENMSKEFGHRLQSNTKERFSWDKIVQMYIDIFEQVL